MSTRSSSVAGSRSSHRRTPQSDLNFCRPAPPATAWCCFATSGRRHRPDPYASPALMSVLVNGPASWNMRLADPRGFLDQVVAFGTGLAVCTDGARGAFAVSATEGRWAVDAVAARSEER